MGKYLVVAKIPLKTVWTNKGLHTWRILACITVICSVPLMPVSTLPLVNYFSTLLEGKEDKCFDLAVSGILFLSYSLIERGSICFKCCHPGLTVVLGNRMLGGMSRCPKAQPRTPRAGAALWHDRSSDLCHVNSHASDSGWQLWGIKSRNFIVRALLLVLSAAGLAVVHTHMHPSTCTYHQPSLLQCYPTVQLGRTAWNMHTWPPGKLTWASKVLTIAWQLFWVKFPLWFLCCPNGFCFINKK